jgi:hypothetical protein
MEDSCAEWDLRSGVWAQFPEGFALIKTSLGHAVAIESSDAAHIFQMPFDGVRSPQYFPPEFMHSPFSGRQLQRPSASGLSGWIPPFGNPAVAGSQSSDARGLRQTAGSLRLANLKSRVAEAEPDAEMDLPPPGNFHFFSGYFGTPAPALIALNSERGELFGWLPGSRTWKRFDPSGAALLDEFDAPESAWRAEVRCDPQRGVSVLYLPTRAGLACVTPDFASLGYDVTYVGNTAAVGSPVAFGGQIWMPLRDGSNVRFVCVDQDGVRQREIVLEDVPDIGGVSQPVALGRVALWLGESGQLRLQKQNDGTVSAAFAAWPGQARPSFEFGCPYLSGDGSLWQLCFDAGSNAYVYVRVDRTQPQPEVVPTMTPRLCSGRANFRFATRYKSPPWQEPEHGDDASSNEFVIPLVEALGGNEVVGVRLRSDIGIANTFKEKGARIPYTLYFDGDDSEVRFHSAMHPEPWRLKVFVHDGSLWAYHPQAKRIQGWRLA